MTQTTGGVVESSGLSGLEYELTLLSRHFLASRQQRGGQTLDRSAYLILTRLGADEAMSLKELAEAFRLDVSTLNRQVAALREVGLVERVPDPAGGVARKIRATEQGLTVLGADRARGRSNIGMVVADWSDAEVSALFDLVAKFNESIEKLENNPWPRTERPS